jgi:hypothetical protein
VLSVDLLRTDIGETTLARLVSRRREYLLAASRPGDRTEERHTGRGIETLAANTLIDYVAIAEAFVSSRLTRLQPKMPESKVFTWKNRRDSWQQLEGVDLTHVPGWQSLQGFVEARNALQHGLGHLTERQLNYREETLAALGAAHVPLQGDVLVLNLGVLENGYVTVRDFVIGLDSRARRES